MQKMNWHQQKEFLKTILNFYKANGIIFVFDLYK